MKEKGGKYMLRHAKSIRVRSLFSAACLATVSVTCLGTALIASGGSAPAYARIRTPVAATSASKAAAKAPVRIVFVNPVPGTPDWDRGAAYVVADQKKYGYTVTVAAAGPVGALDVPTEITEIQAAIADHAQVIMTCVCEGGAYTHVFALAHKAHILTVGLSAGGQGNNLFFGTNYADFGKSAAQALEKKMHGHANIGIISTSATIPNEVTEVNSFTKTLKPYPGMKIAASVYDNSDTSTAATVMAAMITANPSINAIWCVEGGAPGAVESVMKEDRKKPGQITVLAIDLQAPTKAAIRAGYIWATEYQGQFDWMPQAARCATEDVNGAHYSGSVNTGTFLISKSNLPNKLPPPGEPLPNIC
jgi:ABC-type sugar transport system substrate-binding protein